MNPNEPQTVLVPKDDAAKPTAPAGATVARNPAARTPKRTAPKARASPRRTGTARRRRAKGTAPTPGHDAVRLLGGLHASWEDTLEAHRVRVEGRFKEAQRALGLGKRRKAKDLERVRAALKVHLKPRKGRAKDLRRVESALDTVLGRVGGD